MEKGNRRFQSVKRFLYAPLDVKRPLFLNITGDELSISPRVCRQLGKLHNLTIEVTTGRKTSSKHV